MEMWMYLIIILVAGIVFFALYKQLNWEKIRLGKARYKRLNNPLIENLLAKLAKRHRNDRSYFAVVTKNMREEWSYQYKKPPFLCEISYAPQEGKEIIFLFPLQGRKIRNVIILYKKMKKEEINNAIKEMAKHLI